MTSISSFSPPLSGIFSVTLPNKENKIQAHLSVPTPPASRIKLGLFAIFLLIQRAAKALKIWPCATTSTSLGGASFATVPEGAVFGLLKAGPWKRLRMSAMRRSRRSVICSGDLRLPHQQAKLALLMPCIFVLLSCIRGRGENPQKSDVLSTRTSIAPNIPILLLPILLSLLSNIMARQSFIVAIIPFADVVCDFYFGVDGAVRIAGCAVAIPGQLAAGGNAEKLEGALSTVARRNVDVSVG